MSRIRTRFINFFSDYRECVGEREIYQRVFIRVHWNFYNECLAITRIITPINLTIINVGVNCR
jgi:hypothetical protein